MYMQQL